MVIKQLKINKAFTLIELIVVITILAILWTIAFIALQWYSANARDAKRISDIQNIKKSLELFSLNSWKYPFSDDWVDVSYSWQLLRKQWVVWDNVITNLSRNLNKKPTDPLTGLEYNYSVTYSQQEYEILWMYENNLFSLSSPLLRKGDIFLNVNATEQNYPRIDWTYNQIAVITSRYIVPTPSIINGNVFWAIDLAEDETLIKSQIITGGTNLFQVNTWALDIALNVYNVPEDWEIVNEDLWLVIQNSYSGSSLANVWVYEDFLSAGGQDLEDLVELFISWEVTWYTNADLANCSSWSINWETYSSILYYYLDFISWNTIEWTWTWEISNWVQFYTADILCTDWTTSISNEQTSSWICDENYVWDEVELECSLNYFSSWSINWETYSSIVYSYLEVASWNTIEWTWTWAIANWEQSYTSDILCTNWSVSISNEQITSTVCDDDYVWDELELQCIDYCLLEWNDMSIECTLY